MAKYVDGFLLTVPKKKLNAYRALAKKACNVWMKYGALGYYECSGDELDLKWSTIKFRQAAKAKPGEIVFFSFIIYKSKAHRNQVNEKVMKDPLMADPNWKDKPMPFDMKRMGCGGFKVVVEG